ncbi:MAG: MBL fold metallo-hydrolase [Candidatus Latescibacteria bacterium]|nr:MBL fold metallo-hydrolase [Candidatus Latescibacterota bacterium]
MLENIYWLGHASIKISAEKLIYIDPWKLGKDEPTADLILITHGHYDHCSPEDVQKISGEQTTIVCPPDCGAELSGNIETMRPGERLTVEGVEIEAVPAYNVNKSFHPRANGWVGYIITAGGKRIYHAGDTDLIPEMEQVKADVVLLPIGGIYTMDAREAAKAAKKINPQVAIPIHWGDIVGSAQDAEKFRELSQVPVEIKQKS